MAADRPALHGRGELGQQIGSELDIRLASAEHFVETEIGLDGADPAAVAEISGAAFADQFSAPGDVVAKFVGGGLPEHFGIIPIGLNQDVAAEFLDALEFTRQVNGFFPIGNCIGGFPADIADAEQFGF